MPFLGADFKVQSVQPVGLATLRVRFTLAPQVDQVTYTALNIGAYTLTGPSLSHVTSVNAIVNDIYAVDVHLSQPLQIGAWNLGVTGIRSVEGNDLVAPFSVAFGVTRLYVDEPVSMGANNDEVVDVIRKHFNPALKGPNWDALIEAISTGDKRNWDNAKAAFDQLFVRSASGKYLTRQGADQGIRKPDGLAMPDDLYRDLIVVSKTTKLTQDAVLEGLEVFYGPDAVRASITSGVEDLFVLADNDNLHLVIDERDSVEITFRRSEFSSIAAATAVEVAASISRQLHALQSQAYAVAHRSESGNYVRIYSGRLGISSAIRVSGGKAQTTLLFSSEHPNSPDYLFPDLGGYGSWVISTSPSVAGHMRFTRSGASSTFTDFNLIQEGDYVLVYGQEFALANRGTWKITAVGVEYPGPVQWIEVENIAGSGQTVAQISYKSLQFHRSIAKTVHSAARHVTVAQTGDGVRVVIPVTTQAVFRKEYTGAYGVLNGESVITVGGSERKFTSALGHHTKFTTSAAHGLSVGKMVLVENAATDPDAMATSDLEAAGTPSTLILPIANGIADVSQKTVLHTAGTYQSAMHKGVRLGDVALLVGGGRFTNPAGVATIAYPIDPATILRVTDVQTTAEGSRRVLYQWELSTLQPTVGAVHFGIASVKDLVVLTGGVGGFSIIPNDKWDIFQYRDTPRVETVVSGTMPFSVGVHATAHFANKILLCGGNTSWNLAQKTAWTFNLDLRTWTQVADMRFARCEHQAVEVSTGVLVIGGHDPSRQDVETNDFHYWKLDDTPCVDSIGTLTLAVTAPATIDTVGKTGNALRVPAGGRAQSSAGAEQTALNTLFRDSDYSLECWLSDSEGIIFENMLNAGIGGATTDYLLLRLARITGGRLAVSWVNSGGTLTTLTSIKSIFDPSIGLNQSGVGTNWFPFYHLAVTVNATGSTRDVTFYVNGKLLETVTTATPPAFGETGRFSILHPRQIDEVKIVTGVMSAAEVKRRYTKNRGTVMREYPSTALMANDQYPAGPLLNTCEFWNGTTWSMTGSLRHSKIEFATVKLPGNRVLVCGGLGYDPRELEPVHAPLKSVDVWSADTGHWLPLPDMNYARRGHTAVYMATRNEVWVYGGSESSLPEVLDLKTMTWRMIGTPAEAVPRNLRGVGVAIGKESDALLAVTGGLTQDTSAYQATFLASQIIVPGDDVRWTGGMNGIFKVAAVSGQTFSVKTPGYGARAKNFISDSGDGAKVTPIGARTQTVLGGPAGPFTFDLENGIAITGVEAATTAALKVGHQYISLELATGVGNLSPALEFPDSEGWVVFAFGQSKQVWPVRYLGRLSNTALSLDASFTFPFDLPAGTEVHLAAQRGPMAPSGQVAGMYLTVSEAGQKAAIEILEDTIAAGISSDVKLIYPGDRGLGGEGFPTRDNYKLSDAVRVWGGDDTAGAVKRAVEDED